LGKFLTLESPVGSLEFLRETLQSLAVFLAHLNVLLLFIVDVIHKSVDFGHQASLDPSLPEGEALLDQFLLGLNSLR
jgi:hypothetical protein